VICSTSVASQLARMPTSQCRSQRLLTLLARADAAPRRVETICARIIARCLPSSDPIQSIGRPNGWWHGNGAASLKLSLAYFSSFRTRQQPARRAKCAVIAKQWSSQPNRGLPLSQAVLQPILTRRCLRPTSCMGVRGYCRWTPVEPAGTCPDYKSSKLDGSGDPWTTGAGDERSAIGGGSLA
jgi:hypothetical protein